MARHASLLTVLSISVIQAVTASGQIIPAARIANWVPGVTVGVPGDIPNTRTNLIDVTKSPYNADKTGVSDASAAIQSAIYAAHSNDVVYLPTGTYLITNTIYVRHSSGVNYGITLRGAGTNTLLNMTNAASFFVGDSSDYNWSYPPNNLRITAGLGQGSTNLTVANTSPFTPGQIVLISYDDDTNLPVLHVNSFHALRTQTALLTAKTATTLTIWPPLYSTCTLGAVIHAAQYQMNLFGLENMVINGLNSTATYLLKYEQCYGCWIKNVHVLNAYSYHVYIYDSLNCEMRHSYLDTQNHTGPNGGNLLLYAASANLIEDNILTDGFPLVEVNYGSCGNVFGYNYLLNSESDGIIGASFDSNHGPHVSYDLYEGNIASKFQSDGYWGSASELTVFRNWLNGTSPNTSQFAICVSLDRFSRNCNIVGNILGSTNYGYSYWNSNSGFAYSTHFIYTFGMPNMGNGGFSGSFAPPWASWAAWASAAQGSGPGPSGFQEIDTNVLATTLRAGNYNYADKAVNASESLGTNTLPNSLYQPAKPAWFGNLTWPPFDTKNPRPANALIPAGYRFVNNGADPPGVGLTVTNMQPASQTQNVGGKAVFTASVSGVPPMSYQWYFNNAPMTGATNPTLTLSPLSANAGGNYQLVVTNSNGSATGNVASLTVTLQPNIYAISNKSAGKMNLYLAGAPSSTNRVWTTTNPVAPMSQWQAIGTNIMDTNGFGQFTDTNATTYKKRYYRESHP